MNSKRVHIIEGDKPEIKETLRPKNVDPLTKTEAERKREHRYQQWKYQGQVEDHTEPHEQSMRGAMNREFGASM